jgi:hypothetical protein
MKKIFLFGLITLFAITGCKEDEGTETATLSVSITNPVEGQELNVGESVSVTVAVRGAVDVQLWVDNSDKGTKTASPYSFDLGQLTRGAHTIKAIATAKNGNKVEDTIVITVKQADLESPDAVSFADGKIPGTWTTTEWSIDNGAKQDDTYSVKSTTDGGSIATSNVVSVSNNFLEFYVKGNGVVDFYIDDVKGKIINLSGTWAKQGAYLTPGLHTLKWVLKGTEASLDAVRFKSETALAAGTYYQGGVITAVLNEGKRILIAAPEDYPELLTFSNGTVQVPGSFSDIGEVNTQAVINVYEPLSEGKPYAAKIIDAWVQYGYDDWFIPSIDELLTFVDQRNLIGGFDTEDVKYWSSSSNSAHVLMYLSEIPVANRKYPNTSQYQAHHVRPFRAVVKD